MLKYEQVYIKATRWANREMDGSITTGQAASIKSAIYTYNNNKWLKSAHFGTYNPITNLASKTANLYEGNLNYDANGNIQSLLRRNQSGQARDVLSYTYGNGNNQLTSVSDAITGEVTLGEIKGTNSYTYDAIGRLTANQGENIQYKYNTQGLVTEVHYNNIKRVAFFYDERGQRVKKISYNATGTTVINTDYYIRDLSGNVMSIYNSSIGNNNTISQTELPIYGGSRLGVYTRNGTTQYQITDHLGNVRAVIEKNTQNPLGVDQTDYSDYYPFGEKLPMRNMFSKYRYAFQGQELDPETGKEAFQLRLWDGRIGRWLTTDPYGQYHSPYLGMGNNPVSRIDSDGGEDNPVVDENGTMLGTTESGMEGEVIVMKKEDFTQGMSDRRALQVGQYLSQSKLNLTLKTHVKLSIDARPDRDGYVTDMEARDWWANGNGGDLFVDRAKMDLSGFSTGLLNNKEGSSTYFNFFFVPSANSDTGRVYGTVKLTLVSVHSGEVKVGAGNFIDEYDFNPDGRVLRDAATGAARTMILGNGKKFNFYGYGQNPIVKKTRMTSRGLK